MLFAPHENPYYFALPYNDFDANGVRKIDAATLVPWANSQVWAGNESMLKNRWIKIDAVTGAGTTTAYAQWEDVGPNSETDQAYVFGPAAPSNTFGEHAGLDVSPAVMTLLGMPDVFTANWQFVDFADVPDGPWKDTITTSQLTYDPIVEHPSVGADWLTGNTRANTIRAQTGDDTIFGSGGNDRLWGEDGNDHVFGGTGNDALSAAVRWVTV